ncbi:restriction endonuclease subunit S [Streptococcus suis]|nr:restriction endonuclease subunit S [Streptococcus suis]MBY4978043.1 restriction endonuclease subunit S [Streptococcus suis]
MHCAKKPYEKLADGTIQEVKVPYYIPDNWEWVRLGFFAEIISGYAYKSKSFEFSGDFQVLRLGNIKNNELRADVQPVYIDKQLAEKTTKVKCLPNDILVTMTGTRGKRDYFYTYRISENNNFYFNQRVGCIRSMTTQIFSQFLSFALKSESILNEIFSHETGTANQGNIGKKEISNILIPLPPFAEQQRIVEQIERALEKVDAYSESYNKLQELDKNFPDKLKKSILQYAMQGKLVPQDPDDEPVEVLLEKIKAEKQKLYEEGKLKKKDLEELVVTKGDDNSPYGKIPQNWFFLTIKDIFSITTGLSYKKTDLAITKNGVRIIRGGNISPFSFKILDNDYYIDSKFITSETVYLKRNQLVTPVSTSLEHIGKFARIDKDYPNTVAGGFVFQLTPFVSSDVLSKYLLFNLSSPIFYKQLKSITKLSGQALYNIPKTKLNELLVPLAPSTEQERISQRVEQLFEKVNQL